MRAANILETIGNTPHVRVNRLFGSAEVWIKSERANPGGSIKDRIALAMVEDAERVVLPGNGVTPQRAILQRMAFGLALIALAVLVRPDAAPDLRSRSYTITAEDVRQCGRVVRVRPRLPRHPGRRRRERLGGRIHSCLVLLARYC